MSRTGMAWIAALIATAGLVFASTRSEAAPRATLLAQEPDSVQVEVSWGAASANKPVTGYTVVVQSTDPAWTRTSDTPLLADTLWLPRDAVDRTVSVCVVAKVGAVTSTAACGSFVIPAMVVVGPPGDPAIRVISAIGMTFDSLQASSVDAGALTPAQHRDMVEGGTWLMGAIGWTHTAAGPIGFTCVRFSGVQGWKEMRATADGGYTDPAGGMFIADPGCGWAWHSTNPGVATVEPVLVPLGPLSLVDAGLVRAVVPAPPGMGQL